MDFLPAVLQRQTLLSCSSRTAVDRLAELRAEYDYIILMHRWSRQLPKQST